MTDPAILIARCAGFLDFAVEKLPHLTGAETLRSECNAWLAEYQAQARLDTEAEYSDVAPLIDAAEAMEKALTKVRNEMRCSDLGYLCDVIDTALAAYAKLKEQQP